MRKFVSLLLLILITTSVTAQTRYKITLKERELQSTLGNKGVKSVKEVKQQYDYKADDIAPYKNGTYQFNERGLLESYEENVTKYDYVHHYKYYYTDNYNKMTYSYQFFDKGAKTRDVSQFFQLYKTNIGYFADKVDESTEEFYPNGKLKKYRVMAIPIPRITLMKLSIMVIKYPR